MSNSRDVAKDSVRCPLGGVMCIGWSECRGGWRSQKHSCEHDDFGLEQFTDQVPLAANAFSHAGTTDLIHLPYFGVTWG